MKKSTKKTTKKTVKPDFVMNLTNINTTKELYQEFIEAKVRAGKPITTEELAYIKDISIDEAIEETVAEIGAICRSIPYKEVEIKNGAKLVFDEYGNAEIVKPNLFRRFWNWITRKK